jgi:hypothetical protein
MEQYCVNKHAQPGGEHEVHNVSRKCPYLPDPANRVDLGGHQNCSTAVQNSGVSGSSCVWGTWLASGPTLAQFSSQTATSSNSGRCTNHAGWLSDWTLVVPWRGLDAAY